LEQMEFMHLTGSNLTPLNGLNGESELSTIC
jgi:hypothetical protein